MEQQERIYTIRGQKTTDGWMYAVVSKSYTFMLIRVYVINNDSSCYIYSYRDGVDTSTYSSCKRNKLDTLFNVYEEVLSVAHGNRILSYRTYQTITKELYTLYHLMRLK